MESPGPRPGVFTGTIPIPVRPIDPPGLIGGVVQAVTFTIKYPKQAVHAAGSLFNTGRHRQSDAETDAGRAFP